MNKHNIILGIFILLVAIGAIFFITQNMNPDNNIINNTSNNTNNIHNKSNTSDNGSDINKNPPTKQKPNKNINNGAPFYVPKNAKLSYKEAKKIADQADYPNSYIKITNTFVVEGDLFWRVKVYDKKTGKVIAYFAVSDKYGSQELM